MRIVQGELFERLADTIVASEKDFAYNPNCADLRERLNRKECEGVVFCFSHNMDPLRHLIQRLKKRVVVIFHNSDYNISRYDDVINHPMVYRVFAQNVTHHHPKIVPIPIGIANSMWKHGDPEAITLEASKSVKRSGIYLNINTTTNPKEREPCLQGCLAKGIPSVPSKPFESYLSDLHRSEMCVAPVGNGLDTHRFWESLYLGTPVVTSRNFISEYWSYHFPIGIVDDWNQDISQFPMGQFNTKLLDMNYYSKLIKSRTKIVFVALGNIPDFICQTLEICYRMTQLPIVVIVSDGAKIPGTLFKWASVSFESRLMETENSRMFSTKRFDEKFRQGYWRMVRQRFIALERYMVSCPDCNIVHFETDIAVFFDPLDHEDVFFQDHRMGLTIDSEKRGIGGIVTCGDSQTLSRFNKLLIDDIHLNDMQVIRKFYDMFPDDVLGLPIYHNDRYGPYDTNFSLFNSVFDAAAIGQYFYGADPSNFRGKITKIVNKDTPVRYDDLCLHWKRHGTMNVPYLSGIRLNMFHMHNKVMELAAIPAKVIANNNVDVVMPSCEKDLDTLEVSIDHIKKIPGIGTVYVISKNRMTNKAEWMDESLFPFKIEDMYKFEEGVQMRDGWYFQQLLKMYAHRLMPNLSERYLVLDSDTIFLKPTKFAECKKSFFNYMDREDLIHEHYFTTLKSLLGIDIFTPGRTGITHHMVFDKYVAEHILRNIEERHNSSAWEAILKLCDTRVNRHMLSEYELYFNYIQHYFPERVELRRLSFQNLPRLLTDRGYDYVSCHAYLRH